MLIIGIWTSEWQELAIDRSAALASVLGTRELRFPRPSSRRIDVFHHEIYRRHLCPLVDRQRGLRLTGLSQSGDPPVGGF